jgi:hypothetical protein
MVSGMTPEGHYALIVGHWRKVLNNLDTAFIREHGPRIRLTRAKKISSGQLHYGEGAWCSQIEIDGERVADIISCTNGKGVVTWVP